MGTAEHIVKSSQEQASASWITFLNQMRLDRLLEKLRLQDENYENASAVIGELKQLVSDLAESNRGGSKGLHGFIAEATECGFGNARALIEGGDPGYVWTNDNGPVDFTKNGVDIQQKFVQSGGHFGLEAVKNHLSKYPDYLENNGKYQLPKDFYDKVKQISDMSEEEINRLSSSGDGITRAQAEWVKKFLETSGVDIDDLEPSIVNYDDVQQGNINETIENEERNIKERDKEIRDDAYEKSRPTLKEGIKAAGVSAALEGGTAFVTSVIAKRKEGKRLSEFDANDWKEVGIKTGEGTLKGGVRGGVIYGMTNFTATPANVASAYVTAAFGVAAQVRALEKGEVEKDDFVINCEAVCLDVGISAISSLAGEVLIPVPVLGAVIGNIVGQLAYNMCKDYGDKRSQQIIESYNSEMSILDEELREKFISVKNEIYKNFKEFISQETLAFDVDSKIAYIASIELARLCGVNEENIMDTPEKTNVYFLS